MATSHMKTFPLTSHWNEKSLTLNYRQSLFFWNTSLLHDLWLLCMRQGLFHRKIQHTYHKWYNALLMAVQFCEVGYIFHFAKKQNSALANGTCFITENIKINFFGIGIFLFQHLLKFHLVQTPTPHQNKQTKPKSSNMFWDSILCQWLFLGSLI